MVELASRREEALQDDEPRRLEGAHAQPRQDAPDLSGEVLEAQRKEPDLLRHFDAARARLYADMEAKGGWYSDNLADPDCLPIAYFNEGHPGFAILERIRERVAGGMTFDEAARQVRSTTVFTTHTPVAAGHDVFPYQLMDMYFGGYYPLLGLTREAFHSLGVAPGCGVQDFNMTAFALKMSAFRNAVSRRHGEVSRPMWHSLWPDLPEQEVPISSLTNGVHVPTWFEPGIENILDTCVGPDRKPRQPFNTPREGPASPVHPDGSTSMPSPSLRCSSGAPPRS